MLNLRIARILRSVLLAIVPALLLSATEASAQTSQPQTFNLINGRTAVQLSPAFTGALTSLNVTPRAIGRAQIVNGSAQFPIIEGTLDVATARGEVVHQGGLSLTAGTTRVELKNFVIDTPGTTPVLTGLVVANNSVVGRIPLFNLQLPASFQVPLPIFRTFGNRLLVLTEINVTLTRQAATALNGAFNVTAFAEGIPIGQATVVGLAPASGSGH